MNASDPPRRGSADAATGERPATGTFFEPPERAPAAEVQPSVPRGLCRITRQPDLVPDSLALRVWTTPLVLDGRSFTVVAVRDASDEQRRHVLERVFFHDLLNTSTALKALLMLVSSGVRSPGPTVTAQASRLTEQLVDEIESHRALLAAERGTTFTLALPASARVSG